MKASLVLSILFGGLFAFALTAITQPEYTKGLKQSTEIMVKTIWGNQ